MKHLMITSALIGVMSLAAVVDANAWVRNRTVYGPYGGAGTVHAWGGCANGTCSRHITRTGPYGETYSRDRSATCAGGTCTVYRNGSGPYGRTWSSQSVYSR